MIKRNLFTRFSVLLASVLSLYSCEFISNEDNSTKEQEGNATAGIDFPATEKDNNSTVTYQFTDAVELLSDQTQNNYLVKVEQDSILYFLQETPDSIMPRVGEILSSRISDKLPYGLGNEVISMTEEDGLVKIVTSAASLDDIFEELDVKSEFTLEDFATNISSITDEDGTIYEVSIMDIDEVFSNNEPSFSRWQTRASVGSDKVLVIPIDVETESGLYSEIKLVIGAIVTFNKSKSNGTFEYSFEPSVGIIGEFGAKVEKKLDDQIKKLLTILKKTRLFSTHLPIAGGLIDLRPYADLNVDLVGSLNGKISVGFSYYAKFKCGFNERGFFKENTSTDWDLKEIFNSFELKGRAEIGPEATISTGCGLYTTDIALSFETKPSIMVGAELGVSGDSNGIGVKIEDQKVSLDVSIDLLGKGKVSLFGKNIIEKEVTLAEWNIYNKEWPLFPILMANTFNINQRGNSYGTRVQSHTRGDNSTLTFDANYSLSGGEMTKIMKGKPTIIVEKDGEEIKRIISDTEAFTSSTTDLNFELSGLNENTKYTAIPCVTIGDNVYQWEGKEFGSSNTSSTLCPDDNHPHMIDLGLPSGTKWSCCNVGASKPESFGEYYAWGETQAKDCYNAKTYKYYNYDNGEWINIGSNIAGTKYDVATISWGDQWQMPTVDQFEELQNECSGEWTTVNGVYGAKYKGSNGQTIFIPAANCYVDDMKHVLNPEDNSLAIVGYYWSSTSYLDWSAFHYTFRIGPAGLGHINLIRDEKGSNGRIYGYSIRPISK